MDNYEILLNEIKDYLNKNEIDSDKTNSEVISLYDLCKIINQELEGLRNITTNSELLRKLKSYSKLSLKLNNPYIYIHGEMYKSEISFHDKTTIFSLLDVYKEKNINDIYFNRDQEKNNKFYYKFVRKNYDLILETFAIIEEYTDLLGSLNTFSTKLNNDLFSVEFNIFYDGDVRIKIDLNKEHPLYEEYSKKWYQRENICDFVLNHQSEIFKRFIVIPSKLEKPFNKIYNRYKENSNEKEKTLIR